MGQPGPEIKPTTTASKATLYLMRLYNGENQNRVSVSEDIKDKRTLWSYVLLEGRRVYRKGTTPVGTIILITFS